jgi:ATP-dependent DNA helicase RecG
MDVDRYDDRDLIRTNLLDSYDRILAFIQKHLPDPFYIEGIERRSLRDVIFREVASNILIHREYAAGVPARLIIERGKVTTYNANRPHGFGPIDPSTAVPYPKNPVLGAFFREIDRADELGSGMRKMMLYGKKYGGVDPQLIEGDIFRMVISVPEFAQPEHALPTDTKKAGGETEAVSSLSHVRPKSVPSQAQARPKSGSRLSHVRPKSVPSLSQVEILRSCLKEKEISELMMIVGKTNRTRFRNQDIKPLLESGRLEMTIPDKPSSSRQKYRTTEEGMRILASST